MRCCANFFQSKTSKNFLSKKKHSQSLSHPCSVEILHREPPAPRERVAELDAAVGSVKKKRKREDEEREGAFFF